MTIDDLNMRRSLCQICIKTLDELPNDTEGKHEALIEYKNQLASIDAKITKLTGTPPAVVVGLKTAALFGNSGLGER